MSELKNKIDFVALVSVKMANGNGDPLDGNRPRTDYRGFGEISDVCIKRKLRNRMQDMGKEIFVQSEGRESDKYRSLKERAENCEELWNEMGKNGKKKNGEKTDRDKCIQIACKNWMDVRTFGSVFAFSESDNSDSVSLSVRGPVTIHQAISISPVEVISNKIAKSVNGNPSESLSSDRLGDKHMVRFGLYEIKGSINVQLADKTGFNAEDAKVLKECLRTLFVNDASAARPEGAMEVCKLYWFEHNCKDGQYSTAKVHRSVKVTPKVDIPESYDDYSVSGKNEIEKELPGLVCEIIDGI